MTVYVSIESAIGRFQLLSLAEKLIERGFGDRVEYNAGGWQDRSFGIIRPHLKFENHDDAMAYVLAFGGTVSSEPPAHNTGRQSI